MYRNFDPFDELKTDRILFGSSAVVHPDYGQMGVLALLIQLAMKLALSRGAGAAVGVAVSHYSAKSTAKLGGRILRSMDLDTFELPDGTRPFAQVDMGIHRTAYLVSYDMSRLN